MSTVATHDLIVETKSLLRHAKTRRNSSTQPEPNHLQRLSEESPTRMVAATV
jgi:hypothetical protein